ncbi:MAG TPA: DUF2306 domain-containing protein [Sphingomicrobium sp.]|jgi:uncharacterized membrane protein|nr:DUF2306 domain-containing protein [Sphingomicrobium sp.]
MASTARAPSGAPDRLKHAFFVLMGVCVLLVLWTDERFWFDSADPHWQHIAPVKWLLMVHGLGGLTALTAGAFQFSSRLRRLRPALHRAIGKVYIGAVSIAAPVAIYIGTGPTEPVTIRFEQYFQGGLWWFSAIMAWACIRNGQIALHKPWMMRSYGFTLIFVLSRVPDAFVKSYSDQFLSDMLWSLVVVAVIAPELILTTQTLLRIRIAKARHARPSPAALPEEQFAG